MTLSDNVQIQEESVEFLFIIGYESILKSQISMHFGHFHKSDDISVVSIPRLAQASWRHEMCQVSFAHEGQSLR